MKMNVSDTLELGTAAERKTRKTARVLGTAAGVLAIVLALGLQRIGVSPWFTSPVALALGWLTYQWQMASLRRRRHILSQPFPAEWEGVLRQEVVFYRALDPEEQARFRRELQVFLGEKRITGIGLELDTTSRVLAGASAIIPIFGYRQWEWDQISEILIYPGRFGRDFEFLEGEDRNTLGMVGTGVMNRIMILSKPDLLQGFRNPSDKRNVGLHEFAHLLDKSDGIIDGIPGVGLEREAIGPWIELVRRSMAEIEAGDSDLDPYALTNEAEFFAVATEYLFERPDRMRQRHPELFAALQKVFEQNLSARLKDIARERLTNPKSLGRNSPCPCGSGKKYKRCCLK